MKRTTTTTTEEYDKDGVLKTRITETTEEEDSGYIYPQYPYYPYPQYPFDRIIYQPHVGDTSGDPPGPWTVATSTTNPNINT